MNRLSKEQQTLLLLLRRSLWGEKTKLLECVDWAAVDTMAKTQGVASFVYDGVRDAAADIPAELLQKWRGRMLRGIANNERLLCAQDELLGWFAAAQIPAAILKGSSVSCCYPEPALRVLGDIDILVSEKDIPLARETLEKNGYTYQPTEHSFHLSFSKRGVSVELHHNISSYPDSPGGRITRAATENFLDGIRERVITPHTFPVLSESNQALCLLLHMIRHMFAGGIGLRQLCDWMVYAHHADKEAFSREVLPLFERCGLLQYARVATRVCVRYLGLPEEGQDWCADITDENCSAFIHDLFHSGNMGRAAEGGVDQLFTNYKMLGSGRSSLTVLLQTLTARAYGQFPITKKCKLLLPIFWIYLPLRYLVRAALGLRPKKTVRGVLSSSQQRRSLYESLKLFEVEP